MSDGETVELGYISGVFGVRGELRLFLHNRDSDFFSERRAVELVSPKGERRAGRLSARPGAGGRVLGRLEGVDDKEAAMALKGWRLRVTATELPPLKDGEFYVHAVIGLPVFEGGIEVGRLTEMHDHGPVSMFEVSLAAGGVGYVPVLPSHVIEIDAEGGRITLAEGALAAEGP